MALLTIKNLTVGYPSNPVLDHLTFDVNAGDYRYIVGENGAGKSTLMKTLLSLMKPLEGEIVTGDGLNERSNPPAMLGRIV